MKGDAGWETEEVGWCTMGFRAFPGGCCPTVLRSTNSSVWLKTMTLQQNPSKLSCNKHHNFCSNLWEKSFLTNMVYLLRSALGSVFLISRSLSQVVSLPQIVRAVRQGPAQFAVRVARQLQLRCKVLSFSC